MQTSGDWLVPLGDDRCHDPALVGGKASQLHALDKADFPVPSAWVLTQEAFASHLSGADLHSQPERPLLQMDLQAQLQTAAHTLLTGSVQYLAVRSSALSEDGVDHSYAGQHATYYYVTAENLNKAVIDCWMSLWSTAACAYRQHVPGHQAFGMPVIIQQMVPAERSGVCFTRDPTGRFPEQTLIEASWGLGAALVDGRVSPDRYRLDENGNVRDQHIGHKRLKVVANLNNPDGSRLEGVPVHQQTRSVLNPEEAAQLAQLARRAETLFGVPQDMEWAMVEDEVHVLQSRAITALPQQRPAPEVDGRWVLFKPIIENVTEALTPLTVDLFRRVLPPSGRFIQGRFYVDADAMARLIPAELDDTTLQNLLLLRETGTEIKPSLRKVPYTLGILLGAYLSTGITWHRTARAPLDRLEEFAERCEKAVADETVDPLSTIFDLFLPRNPLLPISRLAFQVNIGAGRYFLLLEMVNALLNRWASDFDRSSLTLLTSGGEDMISQQMVEAVQQLAVLAAADPDISKALLSDEFQDTNTMLERLGADHPFIVGFQEFLDRFGHRAIREVELMTPRWREDATVVLQMVRNFLKPDAQTKRIDAHGLRLAARDELHQAVPKRWQRWILDKLLSRVRYYVTARENTRYYHTMAFAATRTKIKQWEQRLLANDRLRCLDDIFFLQWPELSALETGALDWPDVEPLILERRRRYRQMCEIQAPESFNLDVAEPSSDTQGTCRGACASPGIAEGRARVILDPSTGVDLEPGEILVAPYTDPAWTPLFPAAAAVIVEVGSYLSHAGTVAREYQIPCLVDVRDCTRRIETGQLLRVNANEGWVEVISA